MQTSFYNFFHLLLDIVHTLHFMKKNVVNTFVFTKLVSQKIMILLFSQKTEKVLSCS